ncbi:MAG: hypothetical protein U1F25_19835 [Rubrivivax sp.]
MPDLRVLLVEDNPINRQVVGELLKREGARVLTAVHGRDALEQLPPLHAPAVPARSTWC